jgi:hypothetical protein
MRSQVPCLIAALLSLTSIGSSIAFASETVTYTYDALGRLVATTNTGSTNNGLTTSVAYDLAGNRNSYNVSGAGGSGSTCTLAAYNVEGTDEFTLYPGVQKTGPCSEAITVAMSVQQVSGTGQYSVGSLVGGSIIGPSDQYKLLPIYPFYNTVSVNDPLVLSVTWTVVSGNAVISPAQGTVTIYTSN